MSTTTTNYGIVLPDGNDTFNPLTFNNNAFVKVDSQMKKNQDNATTTATHTYIDGVNTILRSVSTANTIIFIASADYVAGSTIAIDGVTCTFRYADGTAPKSGAFKTNQAVMCYLNGTILTMISAGNIPDLTASDIEYDNAETGLDATTVQEAVDSLNTSLANKVDILKLKIQNGYKTITIPPNTATVLSIPFSTPYNSTPMTSVVTSGYGAFMKQLSNVEVSKTQIKVTVEHTWSGGNLEVGVYWSAIGFID